MRRRSGLSASVIVLILAMPSGACGGDDADKDATDSATPSEAPSGRGNAAPPSSPGRLPPEFVQCMAERGIDVESSADIHSAPQDALQVCFGALHQGGG
jgi:hypothetical protein